MSRARKLLERRHLDTFLRISGLAPRVTEIQESERPDFILSMHDLGRVAIEHTQPRDAVRAAHSDLLVNLCSAIQRELELNELPLWIHLTLNLAEAQTLSPRIGLQDSIARDLVRMIVEERTKVLTPWAEYERETMALQSPNLRPLLQVHASECDRAIATWGSKPLEERLALLQSAIDGKAKKLSDYRNHVQADEFWLLVVSGPGLGCLPGQLAPALQCHDDFGQIHVIDEFGQHWFPLTATF